MQGLSNVYYHILILKTIAKSKNSQKCNILSIDKNLDKNYNKKDSLYINRRENNEK